LPRTEPTSFICEHTAEYVLVPRVCEALRGRFDCVTPIFYWATREGSSRAQLCGPIRAIRVISIFARRPKLLDGQPNTIVVRLNEELLERASVSEGYGIPVYAGVPVSRTFAELGKEPKCIWLRLNGNSKPRDIQLYPFDAEPRKPAEPSEIPLDTLVDETVKQARELSWDDAIEALRNMRRDRDGAARWPLFGGYKPFHILSWDQRSV
jgi:hypothetical protein